MEEILKHSPVIELLVFGAALIALKWYHSATKENAEQTRQSNEQAAAEREAMAVRHESTLTNVVKTNAEALDRASERFANQLNTTGQLLASEMERSRTNCQAAQARMDKAAATLKRRKEDAVNS